MNADTFKRALKAHQEGDLNAAMEYYQKFLKVAPREYNALQLLGGVYHAKGDNVTALKYLQASLNIKPEQPQVMLNAATCQRQLQDYPGALATLSKLIRRDSANFGAFKCRMFVLVEMGDYEKAYQELNTQIHKFPGHYELYNLLGAVASECEHYEKAIRAYQKALKIRPNSDVARHNLGLAYRKNGEPEKALKEYQIVLNSGKHSYQLMHNLGDTYFDLGHFEQAATYFRNALKHNFASVESHIGLSETLWQSGEDKLFLNSFEKAVARFPDKYKLLYAYIRRLFRVQHYQKALEVLQSKPETPEAEYQFLLGRCWLGINDPEQAAVLFNKALQDNKLSYSDQLFICRNYLETGAYKEAKTICSSILAKARHHTEALAWWGVCLRLTGDAKEQQLNNYEQLIGSYQLLDKNTDANFYKALVDELSKKHRAHEPVRDNPIVNGTQTLGHLFKKTQTPCLLELEKRIRKRTEEYLQFMSGKSDYTCWPDKEQYEMSSACSIKLNSGGYQESHIRPDSQLTGIFCVAQNYTNAAQLSPPGQIVLGKPPLNNAQQFEVQKRLKPETGRLYIFPSYLWQAISALPDGGQQIIISFEINSPKFS